MPACEWRLNPQRYAFAQTFELRYGDLDVQHELNEQAMGRMLEATRFHMLKQFGGTPAAYVLDTVIAEINFERLDLIFSGMDIVGTASVLRVGSTSFSLATALFSGGACLALSDVVHVAIDAQGRPRRLCDAGRQALQSWMSEQSS